MNILIYLIYYDILIHSLLLMSKHPAKSSDKGEGMLVTKKLDLT